jgi:hypothetical protein
LDSKWPTHHATLFKMIESELLEETSAFCFSWEIFGSHPFEEEFWRLVLDGRTAKASSLPRVSSMTVFSTLAASVLSPPGIGSPLKPSSRCLV